MKNKYIYISFLGLFLLMYFINRWEVHLNHICLCLENHSFDHMGSTQYKPCVKDNVTSNLWTTYTIQFVSLFSICLFVSGLKNLTTSWFALFTFCQTDKKSNDHLKTTLFNSKGPCEHWLKTVPVYLKTTFPPLTNSRKILQAFTMVSFFFIFQLHVKMFVLPVLHCSSRC